MKAPEKIYIEQDMKNNIPLERQYYEDDVIYIRKDALLEWAKGLKGALEPPISSYGKGVIKGLDSLIDKLESL